MRKVILLFFAVLAGLWCRADAYTITFGGGRVQGMHYSAASPHQQATFGLSSDFSFPQGAIPTYLYWAVDGTTLPGSQFTWTSSYVVSAPGKHTATCTAYWVMPGIGGQSASFSKTFAAIGGPLSPGVARAGLGATPARDSSVSPGQLGWYLQYFNFNPSGDTPSGSEAPQLGRLTVSLNQPAGTAYAWSCTGNGVFVGATTGTSVTIGASDQSGYAAVGADCTFTYTDPLDSTLTGSAEDDCDQTPPPDGSGSSDYYKFTAHRPSDIVPSPDQPYSHTTWADPNDYGVRDLYQMKVLDHLSCVAPGVWVQERFPNGEVDGTNQASGEWWITASDGTLLQGSTGIQAWDMLSISFSAPYQHLPPPDEQTNTMRDQKYYGGTKSWVLTDVGVFLATYRCYYWSDYTLHVAIGS